MQGPAWRRRTNFQIPNKKNNLTPLPCSAPLHAGIEYVAMTSADIVYIYTMHAVHIHKYKNLLYAAGVARMVGTQECALLPIGPCSYRSREAYSFVEYMAKCCIRSTGCQHILLCVYVICMV